MELIALQLKAKGYKDRKIEKILGINLLNLYQRVW
jgi:microsomal dipeptidase-like Zn-dependent dipeptidase